MVKKKEKNKNKNVNNGRGMSQVQENPGDMLVAFCKSLGAEVGNFICVGNYYAGGPVVDVETTQKNPKVSISMPIRDIDMANGLIGAKFYTHAFKWNSTGKGGKYGTCNSLLPLERDPFEYVIKLSDTIKHVEDCLNRLGMKAELCACIGTMVPQGKTQGILRYIEVYLPADLRKRLVKVRWNPGTAVADMGPVNTGYANVDIPEGAGGQGIPPMDENGANPMNYDGQNMYDNMSVIDNQANTAGMMGNDMGGMHVNGQNFTQDGQATYGASNNFYTGTGQSRPGYNDMAETQTGYLNTDNTDMEPLNFEAGPAAPMRDQFPVIDEKAMARGAGVGNTGPQRTSNFNNQGIRQSGQMNFNHGTMPNGVDGSQYSEQNHVGMTKDMGTNTDIQRGQANRGYSMPENRTQVNNVNMEDWFAEE